MNDGRIRAKIDCYDAIAFSLRYQAEGESASQQFFRGHSRSTPRELDQFLMSPSRTSCASLQLFPALALAASTFDSAIPVPHARNDLPRAGKNVRLW
jgi:hypothetical protein